MTKTKSEESLIMEDQKDHEKDETENGSIHSHANNETSHSDSQQKDGDGNNKKKLGKYKSENIGYGCFRLTPDEQELAYELKASLMKKLDEQNTKINSELQLHRRMNQMKKQERAKTANPAEQTEMSRQNAFRLMKLYEKNSIKAEARVKELEKDLEISQDLARRYHAAFIRERDKNKEAGGSGTARSNDSHTEDKKNKHFDSMGNDKGKDQEQRKRPESGESNTKSNKSESPRDKKKSAPVSEEDLEDDEALYKMHVARLADTKSVRTTAPIRVTDVIRKSEVTHIQNENLKREVQRLKWDNAQLIKHAKHSKEERDKVLHNLGTSEFARQDLQKRLEKEKTLHQKLQRSLTRQASEWIQQQKESHEVDERRRWVNVGAIAPYDSEGRANYSTKKNVDKPRKMHPVENWDKTEEKT